MLCTYVHYNFLISSLENNIIVAFSYWCGISLFLLINLLERISSSATVIPITPHWAWFEHTMLFLISYNYDRGFQRKHSLLHHVSQPLMCTFCPSQRNIISSHKRVQSNKWNTPFIKQIELYCCVTFRFARYVQNMDRNLSSLFRYVPVKTRYELLFFNPLDNARQRLVLYAAAFTWRHSHVLPDRRYLEIWHH